MIRGREESIPETNTSSMKMWIEDESESQIEEEEIESMKLKLQKTVNSFPSISYGNEYQNYDIIMKTMSSFFIDDEFSLSIPMKMMPFFFNHLTPEETERGRLHLQSPTISMSDVNAAIVYQGSIFKSTKNLSGFEDFKNRLNQRLSSRMEVTVPEPILIEADSAIKLILQSRLYMQLTVTEYENFVKIFESSQLQGSILKGRFRNCLSHRAKKEFVKGGSDLEEKRIAFIQSYSLLGPRERKAKAIELDKIEKMRQVLQGFTIIDELGMAIKAYIFKTPNEKLELRMDFKFPTASLDTLELEIEGLKII